MFGTFKEEKVKDQFEEVLMIEVLPNTVGAKATSKIQLNSVTLDELKLRNHSDNENPVLTRWRVAKMEKPEQFLFCKHPSFDQSQGVRINKSGGGSDKKFIGGIREELETVLPELVDQKFFITLQPSQEINGVSMYEISSIAFAEHSVIWEKEVDLTEDSTDMECENTTETMSLEEAVEAMENV